MNHTHAPNEGRPIVVFDLGGVLLDWNPRYLYRKLFPNDEAGMERFLAEVTNGPWNHQQDAGRPWADAIAELTARHPEQTALIEAFHTRWDEMLGGPIEGTLEILRELKAVGDPIYALTNWSHETYPIALERYDFLRWFDGVLVSGEVGMAKPDPRIFQLLLDRFGLEAGRLVYIDDSQANVDASVRIGMHGIHFTGPRQLRHELESLGLLTAQASP